MTTADNLLPQTPALYSVYEAAEVLHLNPATVWKLAKKGRLRLTKIGRRTVVRRDDLAALIAASGDEA
jgi:excisionase family DNA binding protein